MNSSRNTSKIKVPLNQNNMKKITNEYLVLHERKTWKEYKENYITREEISKIIYYKLLIFICCYSFFFFLRQLLYLC